MKDSRTSNRRGFGIFCAPADQAWRIKDESKAILMPRALAVTAINQLAAHHVCGRQA
jgi:hypothetical protein